MDNKFQEKFNLEAQIWHHSNTFRICKERVLKNVNFTKSGSEKSSDKEIKEFENCVIKNFKA